MSTRPVEVSLEVNPAAGPLGGAIAVVTLLVFGPRRLPEMAKGIGQSVREFRKGIRDIRDDISKDDEPKKATVVDSPTSPTVTPVSVSESTAHKTDAVTAEPEKEPVKSA